MHHKLSLFLLVFLASAFSGLGAQTKVTGVVPDQVILTFEEAPDLNKLNRTLKKYGATLLDQSQNLREVLVGVTFGGLGLEPYNNRCELTGIGHASGLTGSTGADGIKLNYYLNGAQIVSTSAFVSADGYNALDLCGPDLQNDFDRRVTFGGDGVVVAVLDTGVDPTPHPDIFGGIAVEHYTFSNPQWQQTPAADANGHGTKVAALVAEQFKRAGKEHLLTIISIKVLGDDGFGSTWELDEGIKFARSLGVDIVNISLGAEVGPCFDWKTAAINGGDETSETSRGRREVIAEPRTGKQQQPIFICSAGNNFTGAPRNIDVKLRYPASSTQPNVLTVGSLECGAANPAAWSNYGGDRVDLLAPGENLLLVGENTGDLEVGRGTSYSTPMVSGALAAELTKFTIPHILEGTFAGMPPAAQFPTAGKYIFNTCVFEPICKEEADKLTHKQASSGPAVELTVGPNPFREQLRLRLADGRNEVTIVDGIGRTIRQITVEQFATLSVADLQPGTYFLVVRADSGTALTFPLLKTGY